jgi:hypothetical protein
VCLCIKEYVEGDQRDRVFIIYLELKVSNVEIVRKLKAAGEIWTCDGASRCQLGGAAGKFGDPSHDFYVDVG